MDVRILNPKTRIILALDCFDRSHSFRVMDECVEFVDLIKVNYPLILKEGLNFISELKLKYNKPIIADFKVADVPFTNKRIAQLASDAGADILMVHVFIGTEAIFELNQISKDLEIIIVTELTHPGGLEFSSQHAEDAAKICKEMDCLGIQAPGTRPEKISLLRNIVGKDKLIIACGIGEQGGIFHEVISAGSDYGIIGRAIYNSQDPRSTISALSTSLPDKLSSYE